MTAVENNTSTSSSSASGADIIKLQSNDGQIFPIQRALTRHSNTITTLFMDLGLDTDGPNEAIIPLPNLNAATLKKVLVWAEHHKDENLPVEDENKEKNSDDITSWDKEFFNVEQALIFDIILAANYLDMKALLETGCKTLANMIKGKKPEEIRSTFNIAADLTKDEEDQIRRENAWCED